MNALIAELERMLQRLIGEHIRLETVPSRGACFVNADKGQIEQVVMNLAVNARDAMPDGGRITIRTSTATLGPEECARNPELRPGEYVLLTVNDTGCGMDAGTRERIFEPFFTTKPEGAGTGLGLSTVYGIVKQTGGHLEVESEPGRGAEFKVYLPAILEDARAEEGGIDRMPAPGGGETILLVEDEDLVRRMVASALRRFGYTVIETESGHGAIDRLSRPTEGGDPPRIDLLITDVVMPEMSGPELAGEIRKLQDGIRTLYISGYTENAMARRGDLQRGEAFLQKPFTPSELAKQVRGILEAG
jgi:CheY-like chemotaxis protein